MSTGYRFYLLKAGDQIAAIRVRECPTDTDALLQADAVLQASIYLAVEVCNGARRVGILSKPLATP
jgi:hypothetical protein